MLLGSAGGIGTRSQSAATADDAATGRFGSVALPLQLGEDTTHPGNRNNMEALLMQQEGQLVLAPAGGGASARPGRDSAREDDQEGWGRWERSSSVARFWDRSGAAKR